MKRIPTGEELRCLVCRKGASEIHHVQLKGMGGSKERDVPMNKVPICGACHKQIHDKRMEMRVRNGYFEWREKAKRFWVQIPVQVNKRHGCLDFAEVGSAAAEVEIPGPETKGVPENRASAAAPSASGESSVAEPLDKGALPTPARDSRDMPSPSATPPSFNLNSWCAEGMQLVYWGIALRDAKDEVRFRIGDWFNEGEAVLSDEALGYLRAFEDVTVRQYSWVAGRVAPDTRVSILSFTHHRTVAHKEPPEQKELLALALEENLDTKEFHRLVHGEKPRTKRWSWAELEGHLCHTCREVVSLMEAG